MIAVVLVLSMSVTAFADDPNQNGSAGPGQQQNGGFRQGQMPGGAPQMNGQAPDGNCQPPQMNGQAPGMGGPNGSGEAPADLPEPPEMDGDAPMMGGLLEELLANEIITQSEYDALIAAQTK